MDEQEVKALENIDEYGCHVLSIMEEDDLPRFTYSIGINKTQSKPDIVIMGLKSDLAQSMINNYKDRLLAGESFEPGKFYSDFIGGFDVCFVPVAKKHFEEHFGWGLWLHRGDNFEVLQMVWPTTEGVWPWDHEKSDYYQWAQPILNENGTLKSI